MAHSLTILHHIASSNPVFEMPSAILRRVRSERIKQKSPIYIHLTTHEQIARIHRQALRNHRKMLRILLHLLSTLRIHLHRIQQRQQLLVRRSNALLGPCMLTRADRCARSHVIAQNLDLFLEGAPELILFEGIAASKRIIVTVVFCIPGEVEKRGDEGFFEVREAEVVGDFGDGVAELGGEVDALLVLELLLPVLCCCGLALIVLRLEEYLP